MKDSFYSSFEGKHRGEREDIKNRLRTYLPFLTPFSSVKPEKEHILLDLGCGRGEWLELVTEAGFIAKGADLDDGMLSYCKDFGLDVVNSDAISFLKSYPENSVDVISSFHVVEHIGFANVQLLIEESFRVLKPGGLLILETPNPENIVVASSSFYLDPTHTQPIPNQLLAFLTEYTGFNRTKILRLQESKSLYEKENIELIDVLAGVSPDYSVIAQKEADNDTMSLFDEAFAKEYGLSFNILANKFDINLNARFYDNKCRLQELKNKYLELNGNYNEVKEHSAYVMDENNLLKQRIEHLYVELEHINEVHQHIYNEQHRIDADMNYRIEVDINPRFQDNEEKLLDLQQKYQTLNERNSQQFQINAEQILNFEHLNAEVQRLENIINNSFCNKVRLKILAVKYRISLLFNKNIIKRVIAKSIRTMIGVVRKHPRLMYFSQKILLKLRLYPLAKKIYQRFNTPGYNNFNSVNVERDTASMQNLSERSRHLFNISRKNK